MRTSTLALLAFLLLAAPAAAQTHVCDTAAPANPSVTNPWRVSFCSDLKDVDGVAIDPASVQLRVTVDGTAQPLRALPTPTGAASATGFSLYEVGGLVAAKGAHSVTITLVTADGEALGGPFGFTVRGKPVKPPVRTAVAQ